MFNYFINASLLLKEGVWGNHGFSLIASIRPLEKLRSPYFIIKEGVWGMSVAVLPRPFYALK
jgi:hypothetical protein